jgi:hypothetical protein
MSDTLPDGRSRLEQENSLLRSQFANCHKEIARLRAELLRYTATSDVAICLSCGKPAIGRCEGRQSPQESE